MNRPYCTHGMMGTSLGAVAAIGTDIGLSCVFVSMEHQELIPKVLAGLNGKTKELEGERDRLQTELDTARAARNGVIKIAETAQDERDEARAEVDRLRVELDKANSNRDGLSREYWHLKRKTERLMASLKGIRVWCANRIERIPLKGNEELHALAGEVYQEADGAIGFD